MMLTPDHPNATLLLHGFNSLGTLTDLSDPEKVAEAMASLSARMSPDLVVHTAGQRHATVLDVAGFMADAAERSKWNFTIQADWAMADDTWAVVHGHVAGEFEGRKMDAESLGIWRFAADGTIVEHWECMSDPEGQDLLMDLLQAKG